MKYFLILILCFGAACSPKKTASTKVPDMTQPSKPAAQATPDAGVEPPQQADAEGGGLTEQKALEDVILALVGPLAEGVDLQAKLAKDYADKRVGDTPIYDFGVGKIDVTHPGHMAITWMTPTKVPRIFEHFGIEGLSTHFAHDAGQIFSPIELENITLFPVNYFIEKPDSREAEAGPAKDASFRAMSFAYRAGQVRKHVNGSGPLRR